MQWTLFNDTKYVVIVNSINRTLAIHIELLNKGEEWSEPLPLDTFTEKIRLVV